MLARTFQGLALGILLGASGLAAAQPRLPVSALVSQTHVHGFAVDRQDPSFLFIATHHGLFRAGPDGIAEHVSAVQDFMGFTAHPTEPALLFASGHPLAGGNLGFIVSRDGGRTWIQRSLGINGPVDFHQMTVSRADHNVIYGAYGMLQVSRDAGHTWQVAGRLPDELVDLAASALDPDTLTLRRLGVCSSARMPVATQRESPFRWMARVEQRGPNTATLHVSRLGPGVMSAMGGRGRATYDFLLSFVYRSGLRGMACSRPTRKSSS
jgi:hypothetical protein